MMDSKIVEELNLGVQSKLASALLDHAKHLVKMSRDAMSHHYSRWDVYDDVYRGYRYPDSEDRSLRLKQQPEKMVVPLAYAQISTFVAFCLTLFTQKENFVELSAGGPEDELAAKLAEALIARDLQHSQYIIKLKQFLMDVARFSIGVFKHSWVKETQMVRETRLIPGSQMAQETQLKEVVKFLGNKIENISPYRFFPDPRLPLTRFQEGEFCASEDEYTIIELKRQEKAGVIAGVKHIQNWSQEQLAERNKSSRLLSQGITGPEGQSKGSCVVTEVQVWLVPQDFKLDSGHPLGKEDYPVLYVLSYVNDSTVIRLEPMNYAHNKFTYDVGEFNPDQHTFMGLSLSETMDMLQATISWFVNSHITSVRRVIQNRLLIDPSGIEMEDIKQDKHYIRLNMSGAGGDVRRYLTQLQVTDVTANHIRDAEVLHEMLMTVTGISENAMGQYAPGRRSATEARNVNFNAASRLKIIAQTLYCQALEPMYNKLISNLRDGLDAETYVKVRGVNANVDEFTGFKVTREQLIGEYDFVVFDGTLPSDKVYMAQQIGDLLQTMMSSPEAVSMFGYDPRKLLDRMFELRGLKNLQSLKLDQNELNGAPTQTTTGGAPAGVAPTQGTQLIPGPGIMPGVGGG